MTDGNELLDSLTSSFIQTAEKLREQIDGCLVLIDEADKPMAPAMGALAKLLTERLTKLGCHNVTLGLAGVTGVVNKLRDGHESAPRIFHGLTLGPLAPADRLYVIQKGLEEAENINGVKTIIQDDAAQAISSLSEGYPNSLVSKLAVSPVGLSGW